MAVYFPKGRKGLSVLLSIAIILSACPFFLQAKAAADNSGDGLKTFGTSVQSSSEGEGPFFGRLGESFTYRLQINIQDARALKSGVFYIPIPQTGKKSLPQSEANGWNARLTGLTGGILDSSDRYELYYSTLPDPTTLELGSGMGDNGYSDYRTTAPQLAQITMLKIKVKSELTSPVTDDLKLVFECKDDMLYNTSVSKMTTRFKYVMGTESGEQIAASNTAPIEYTIPVNSVSGTAYLDTNGTQTLETSDSDLYLESGIGAVNEAVTVKLFREMDRDNPTALPVAEILTGSHGKFQLIAPEPGEYFLEAPVSPPAGSGTVISRKLLDKGTGSILDAQTGRSDTLTLNESSVEGLLVGYRDSRTFTLSLNAGGEELPEEETIYVPYNGISTVSYLLSPAYLATTIPTLAPTVTSNKPDEATASVNARTKSITLYGKKSVSDSEITFTVELSDNLGGTVEKAFRVKVLPGRVTASFLEGSNFYTGKEYDADEVSGGVRFSDPDAVESGQFRAVSGREITSSGERQLTQEEIKLLLSAEGTHVYTDEQMGSYSFIYQGVDKYGRPLIDAQGNTSIERKLIIHGAPELDNDNAYHTRIGKTFDALRENDGISLLKAHFQEVSADGKQTVRAIDSGDQGIRLKGYRKYQNDGVLGDIFTTVPNLPGMYEITYLISMPGSTAVFERKRNLYLHGQPGIYVPEIVTLPFDNDSDKAYLTPDDLVNAVWSNQSVKMNTLIHIGENGEEIKYSRQNIRLYDVSGNEINSDAVPSSSGEYLVAAAQDGSYMVDGTSLKANIFLKEGGNDVRNEPGVYPVVLAFRDNLDGLGESGAGWEKNKNYAFVENPGDLAKSVGYTEVQINIVVAGEDTVPILPTQDQLFVNFVSGDAVTFNRLDAYCNNPGSVKKDTAGIQEKIDSGAVRQYSYDDGRVEYYEAADGTSGTVSLLEMLETALKYKTHDADIHQLKDKSGVDTIYDGMHAQAVEFLWDSLKVVSLTYTAEDGPTTVENHDPETFNSALLQAAGTPGSYLLEVTADNVKVENGSSISHTEDEDHVRFEQGGQVWWIIRDRDLRNQASMQYLCYMSSGLSYRLAAGGDLVTYEVHIPYSGVHPSMEAEAFYFDGQQNREITVPVTVAAPDISTPNTAVPMDYISEHPISAAPGGSRFSAFATKRQIQSNYKGTAFVNDHVKLTDSGGAEIPVGRVIRVKTGDAVNLKTAVKATVNHYGSIREPAEKGAGYPTGTWKSDDPLQVKIYESSNLQNELTDTEAYRRTAPGLVDVTFVAEDVYPGHPYHNGPNKASVSIRYIFDSEISLDFGDNVIENKMNVLATDSDDTIITKLQTQAGIRYGDSAGSVTELTPTYTVQRDANHIPISVEVCAEDMVGGQSKSAVIQLNAQEPPYITIICYGEDGSAMSGLGLAPITAGLAIGSPFVVSAPYLPGFGVKPDTQSRKTITVMPGENKVRFDYVDITSRNVEYRIDCVDVKTGSVVLSESLVGIVGSEVIYRAQQEFYQHSELKYMLAEDEQEVKSLVLKADPAENVIVFRYDPQLFTAGGGGEVKETVTVTYVSGEYGMLNGPIGNEEVEKGSTPKRVPGIIPMDGYTFYGWYQEGSSQIVDPTTVVVDRHTTFFACYLDEDGNIVGNEAIPQLERNDHNAYLSGYSDGTFRPDASITRAEVVTIFTRLLKKPMPEGTDFDSSFADVRKGSWYANQVAYLERFGVISGYKDGTFRPNNAVTRAEFVAIASRFEQPELTSQQYFPDVPNSHWASVVINSSYLQGWIGGYKDGTFQPDKSITRAEAVSALNRLLKRSADREFVQSQEQVKAFRDVPANYWGYYDIIEAANAHEYEKKDKDETWSKLK